MEKFYFLTHDNHDAYFNLASEEYLLKQKDGYYVYLWVNEPAVIVGVNQNTMQEVNLSYTEEKGIKVVRRQTGGGAVYHDLGNICYTVIAPFDETVNNYEKFTAPVIEYLNLIGIKAEFSGRNDISVDGKKISGNAQTVYGDRIMHHGTLLFKTDMDALTGALKPNKLKIESKGIKSVRARVTNIYDNLLMKMEAKEFLDGLRSYFRSEMPSIDFSDEDIKAIHKLVKEKYSTYEWNIGGSPKGKNRFDGRFKFGTITLCFDTEKGVIQNAQIFGDFFAVKDVTTLADNLNGVKFNHQDVEKALSGVGDYIKGASAEEIAKAIFA